MAKAQQFEFENFQPINEDFEAELEINEKEIVEEQRFIIQDELLKSLDDDKSVNLEMTLLKSEKNTIQSESDKMSAADNLEEESAIKYHSDSNKSEQSTKNSESMTDYFQQGSSKLG